MENQVFISHIDPEKDIALRLQALYRSAFGPDFKVFVSSNKRSIGGGKQWFDEIVSALRSSKVVIPLLSRESVEARWINFEAGVGLGVKARVIPVVLGDLQKGDLGPPLSLLQLRDLSDVEEVRELLNEICEETGRVRNCVDTESFVQKIQGHLLDQLSGRYLRSLSLISPSKNPL